MVQKNYKMKVSAKTLSLIILVLFVYSAGGIIIASALGRNESGIGNIVWITIVIYFCYVINQYLSRDAIMIDVLEVDDRDNGIHKGLRLVMCVISIFGLLIFPWIV